MTLEEEFYKEVTPEGRNNYVLSGQAKVLLSLCKAIDELRTAEQNMQRTCQSTWLRKFAMIVESPCHLGRTFAFGR